MEDAFFLPKATKLYLECLTLVQNIAIVHSSEYTRGWLDANNMPVLSWSARSSNLKIIENEWGAMSRHVDANGRQFAVVHDCYVAEYDLSTKIATLLGNLQGDKAIPLQECLIIENEDRIPYIKIRHYSLPLAQ